MAAKKPDHLVFIVGQQVWPDTWGLERVPGKPWLVVAVESYTDICECFALSGQHSKDCPVVDWQKRFGHPQRVTIVDSEGKEHKKPGNWFKFSPD